MTRSPAITTVPPRSDVLAPDAGPDPEPTPALPRTPGAPPLGPLSRVRAMAARRVLDLVMTRVDVDLVVADGTSSVESGEASPVASTSRPTIVVNRPDDFFARLGLHPALAVGEGYVALEWSPAPGWDLAAVLQPFAERLQDSVPRPLRALRSVVDQPLPRALRNTLAGASRNIRAHYDLSNELFAAFLDASMTYSSALFDESVPFPGQDLEQAQMRKMDAVLDRARVGPGTRVLEIGTGWGGLALRAAGRGAQVLTVTLSNEQAALARERVRAAGFGDRVEVRVQDYRQTAGSFDAVVSVEMIEAVGEEYWPTYLETVDARLAPGGIAVVQSIVMPHWRYLATRGTSGWVGHYIFPGGALPSLQTLETLAAGRTALRVREVHTFGQHYAETLRRWRGAFLAAWDAQVQPLGFNEEFRRVWEFYLAYCQAGFAAGAIDVAQLVLDRPAAGPIAPSDGVRS